MELHGSLAGDALESAADYVQRFIQKICEDSDLYYKLKYDPYQPDRITISGLATGDYQLLNDLDVPEFVCGHLNPIPQELKDQLNSTQSICTMGILPEIGRAYMTIDADLYVWNYEDNSDLAYFDGISDTITKVAIAKPKAGVFQKHIHCLVIVATTKEIVLLAASFTNNNITVRDVSSLPDDFKQADMYLFPDALFKIPIDDTAISDIIATSNGRIFFTEEEILYELDYQDKGWFSRRCRKINHSKSFISYFLPSVSLITGKEERLVRLCLDDTRHILYSLSENGSIQVYDLRADGNSIVKVASLSHGQIQELAAAECRSVDASFFVGIVGISPVPYTQSRYLHLIATTRKGVRLFFSCFPPPPKNAYQVASKSSVMNLMESMRPSCLRLKHVRLPPGYGISPVSFHPLSIYDTFYAHEIGIMAGEAGVDISNISVFCSSNFPTSECLIENVTQLHLKSLVMTITKTVSRASFFARRAAALRHSAGLSFYRDISGKFIILCEKGIQIISHRAPVDMLRDILRQFGPDSPHANYFMQLHGLVNVGEMILTILCTECGAGNTVKDSALRMFFMLSSEKIRNKHLASSFRTNSVSQSSFINESLSDISLHIRSPLFSSTPQQPKRFIHPPRESLSEVQNISSNRETLSTDIQTYGLSCRHDALFLHFSRIVEDLWNKPLCQMLPSNKLVSAYCVDELEWLLQQLTPFKKVIEDYELIGNVQEYVQPLIIDRETSNSRIEVASNFERRSLLSFRQLLSLSAEVLMLWKILCEHQFHVIATLLSTQSQNCLSATSLCNIVLNGQQLCADLITCLIRHYLDDNATTTVLCNELRNCCPSLFSVDDANTTKATEMIEEVRRLPPCSARTEILAEAVKLLKTGIQKINLPVICQLLYEVDYVEGIVDLALERAERDDTKLLAVIAYKNHCGENDVFAQEAFARRKDAYKCIIDTLDRLMNDQKTAGTLDLLNPSKDLIIQKVLESKDELANVAIFKWLLDNDFSSVVLQSKSPFLESFLHRCVEEGGSSRYLDLLWRFHERNSDHVKAATLLYQLAQRETDAFDIQRRIAYLSQAAMCVHSVGAQVDKDPNLHNLVVEIRDKLDVAQIQLATRDLVQSMPRTHGTITAKCSLEKKLYTVQELFEKFAIPLDLPEIKLALCFCSSTYDEDAIEDFYTEIIDRELFASEGESREVRIQRLATRIASLAKKYSSVPKYYPLEMILSTLLNRGMREGFSPSFFHFIGTRIDAPLNSVVDALSNIFRRDPFYQKNNTASRYLMRSALHVITKFVENSCSIYQQCKTALASKCLDLIAAFLISLSQAESTVPDQKKLAETFTSLQNMLENI
ncbi:Nup133 N terminal like family protein [Acanthocheilonema viteae]